MPAPLRKPAQASGRRVWVSSVRAIDERHHLVQQELRIILARHFRHRWFKGVVGERQVFLRPATFSCIVNPNDDFECRTHVTLAAVGSIAFSALNNTISARTWTQLQTAVAAQPVFLDCPFMEFESSSPLCALSDQRAHGGAVSAMHIELSFLAAHCRTERGWSG